MKKVIKVNIPEPCHEDWSKMTTTEKGAFCKVCTKGVVDFTTKNDEDIVKYVLKNNNACGRFSKSQLDRGLKLERSAGQKLVPLAASLLLPLTMMASTVNIPKQESINAKTYTSLGIGSLHHQKSYRSIIVHGIIRDASGLPLKDVLVTVKESGKTTITDEYGAYKISIFNNETLIFSKDGYTFFKEKFSQRNQKYDLTLKIAPHSPQIMGRIMTPKDLVIEEKLIEKKDNAVSIYTVTGVITDDQGLPLPGANIIIKGINKGTQTDFDGNYSIGAPLKAVLVVSYLGFESKEIKIDKTNQIVNVSLDEYINGGITLGVIVTTYSSSNRNFWPFTKNNHNITDQEREAERKARKKAEANGRNFKKLKMAREKEARKLKRASRKKK